MTWRSTCSSWPWCRCFRRGKPISASAAAALFAQTAHPRRALIGPGHGVAAVDREIDPGDVGGVVGAQEEDGTRDVLGIADAAERMVVGGDAIGLTRR